MRAGIALGSNLGDRHSILEVAVINLHKIHERGEFLVSKVLETKPVDCPLGTPNFLNAVAEIETSLTPLALLKSLQSLEVKAGRSSNHGFHEPRTLDLDILYCDDLQLDHPLLQLPHPLIKKRYFVLKPLSEIRPSLKLQGWNLTCKDYLLRYGN